jgi:hypothetical protein
MNIKPRFVVSARSGYYDKFKNPQKTHSVMQVFFVLNEITIVVCAYNAVSIAWSMQNY